MHDLAARLARGDETAFAELYDACADRLYRYLAARLDSRDAASDVLQTAFLRAVKNRRQFRSVEDPVAYLFQIARNEAIRSLQRNSHASERVGLTTDALSAADREPDREDAESVAASLQRLEPDDREIIELKIYAGLTFREIAALVGRPPATVATRYRRALESLRGWLTKQFR